MIWRVVLYIEPDEDEFHGFCPFLKGLHAGGNTREETLQYLGDALSAYMQSIIKHDDVLDFDSIEGCSIEELMDNLNMRIEELGYSPEEIEVDIEEAIKAVRNEEMES